MARRSGGDRPGWNHAVAVARLLAPPNELARACRGPCLSGLPGLWSQETLRRGELPVLRTVPLRSQGSNRVGELPQRGTCPPGRAAAGIVAVCSYVAGLGAGDTSHEAAMEVLSR